MAYISRISNRQSVKENKVKHSFPMSAKENKGIDKRWEENLHLKF